MTRGNSTVAVASEVDLIVAGGCTVTMDATRRILRNGAIAIDGGEIVAVGPSAEVVRRYNARRTISAAEKVVIPGLIDSHNHPIHYLSKGIADDFPVQRRWRERVWPFEANLTAEEARLSAVGTFIEMMRSGTTCFNDPGTFHPDSIAEAAIETGIRGVVSRLAWDHFDPAAPDYTDSTETALARGRSTVERWHRAAGGRVRAGFSLVRSAHVTDELCRAVAKAAQELDVIVHGHMCTTRQEVELSKKNSGMTPLERYRRLGILGPNLILVHLGWIEPHEVGVLAEHDVTACHCPSASMLGGFGCISHGKFPEMVDAKVRVVLGSDACAISRFVDMVRVMYLAACAHKDARADPTVIGAHKAIEMATIDAARALMWDDEIGSLEVGKRADLVILDADGPAWHPNPLENPVANLIYSASGSSVRTVIVDGRVVIRDRTLTTVDETIFLAEADKVSSAILARHGIPVSAPWPMH